jgi:hypothetical protein
MSNIIAAVLMVGGPIIAAVFVVAVVAVLGLVGYDVVSSREGAAERAQAKAAARARQRTYEDAETRISLQRGIARAFVIVGGAFWGIAVIATLVFYHGDAMSTMALIAIVPFILNVACLAVGWFLERTASVMLALISAGAVWWGLANAFEPGVWMLFIMLLIGPMLTAAALFWMARQGEAALELRLALEPSLEPAMAPAEVTRY